MVTIIGISGSLRAGSLNTFLLRALAAAAPAGVTVDILSIRDVPLYDGDREAADGVPPAVQSLKDRVAAAHGLLLVTPEYNNSLPGVLKNTIDWMSRPPADVPRVFHGLPVAVTGATPGQGATSLAQAAWLPVLRTLGTLPYFQGRLGVSGAAKLFDKEGALTDEATRERVVRFIEGFAEFARRHARR